MRRVNKRSCILFACCFAAAGAQGALWPSGRVPVLAVDAALEPNATTVLEELERRTLLSFVRDDGAKAGLTLRTKTTPRSEGTTELCCFDPSSRTLRRELAEALLRALGAVPEEDASGLEPPSVVKRAEAEELNRLYAPQVLPPLSALPARVEVGIWQIGSPQVWPELVGGRGRRIIAGTMRWARGLAGNKGTPLHGVIGALPTFVFRDSKAEVVLLGPESAELVASRHLPAEPASEGLGAGIRRVTLHARRAGRRGVVAGVPTYLGDGSALFLRAAFAELDHFATSGQDLGGILQERRSALAWSEASRRAESHGALLGLPTFAQEGTNEKGELEVVLLRGPGVPRLDSTGLKEPEAGTGGGSLFAWVMVGSLLVSACYFVARHTKQGRHSLTTAEREFANLVDSL
eukprot:TRINITY_DN74175_c0_g1_i1.p1 TRINITY_DN74175_c0_g1~~TRINITY_DN74175_c0_g1_i1.p1  ORF type:complete len:406 (-),score=52.27 TRINITY_DN74175_c0_g1_i1:7-1224(-)